MRFLVILRKSRIEDEQKAQSPSKMKSLFTLSSTAKGPMQFLNPALPQLGSLPLGVELTFDSSQKRGQFFPCLALSVVGVSSKHVSALDLGQS
jgi:hypothetical protein